MEEFNRSLFLRILTGTKKHQDVGMWHPHSSHGARAFATTADAEILLGILGQRSASPADVSRWLSKLFESTAHA